MELHIAVSEAALRLMASVLVGGSIGFNREMRGKPAGLRTHAIVALGAAVAVVVVAPNAEAVSRVIQGIIAGVGFLGGGAILKTSASPQETVHGLTTAASIWLCAALGTACGAGQWLPALIAVGIALFVLVAGGPFEGMLHRLLGRKPSA